MEFRSDGNFYQIDVELHIASTPHGRILNGGFDFSFFVCAVYKDKTHTIDLVAFNHIGIYKGKNSEIL